MVRVFIGLIKGGLVGGAIGFAATKAGLTAGAFAWALYALVGFAVGIVCGKSVWRHETLWTPILKGIVGVIISAGLYWLAGKVLSGVHAPVASPLWTPEQAVSQIPVLLAPIIGILYGIFVEVDDGESKSAAAASK